MEAHVNSRMVGDIAVLDVGGELDLYTSPKLKSAIDDLVSQGHSRLLINLTETTYLDSTALSILSAALKHVRDRNTAGNVGLIYTRPQIERMFSITGLNEVFPVFKTESEALEAARTWAKGRLKT